jgi:cytochrome c5
MPSTELTSSPFAIACALAVLVVGGCAGDENGNGAADGDYAPLPVRIVAGAPSFSASPPEARATVTSPDAVTVLGAAGPMVLVGTATAAYGVTLATDGTLEADAPAPLEIWGDATDLPTATGEARAVARRASGLILAAAQGLFASDGDRLLLSPASDAADDLEVRALASHGLGASEELWIAAPGGVYALGGGARARWSIAGVEPSRLLATATTLFVGAPSGIYEIDRATRAVARLDADPGAVRRIAAHTDGGVYVAAARGLFARAPGGGWSHFTLGADGATPVAADDLVFEPTRGMLVVAAGGLLLAGAADVPEGLLPLAAASAARLGASDDFGNVWLADGAALTSYAVGTPVGFAADVAPIIAERCAVCHATGANMAPVVALADYDTAVVRATEIRTRIATAQMPPPGATPLGADELEKLLRWFSSGMKP